MPGFAGRFFPFGHLFVTTTLTLPHGKRSGWIRATLVDRAIRGNDLSTATRAGTPARGVFLDVDCQRVVVSHFRDNASTK